MALLSYRRHRFPPPIIQHAIWLYFRFTLSYRDVEDLLAERGLEVSYETVRRWVLKLGATVAQRLRKRRPRPSDRWHVDEMVVRIAGRRMYLWRAIDHEGEILDMLVQRRRDKRTALKLMRKLLRKHGFAPRLVVTDKLRSYGAASQHPPESVICNWHRGDILIGRLHHHTRWLELRTNLDAAIQVVVELGLQLKEASAPLLVGSTLVPIVDSKHLIAEVANLVALRREPSIEQRIGD